ncbi:MAG: mechanosensitive ion channel [Flavobacteriales bacterium]|nr:mechanosensitive ion channel [Flavobacteriales bacterium]
MDVAVTYGLPLAKALAVLLIGLWIIKLMTKVMRRYMSRSKLDDSLRSFLISIVSNLLKVLLLISVLGMLGVEMTSFIALLGAAGLAIGMALSGTLQNFAGGVMLLIFKPFTVGDLITAQGHTGTVKEIQVFVTILLSPDNKTILIPNGPLSNEDIINFTKEGLIRVDLTIGIGYGEDIKQARKALMAVMEAHELVLREPAPFVGVSELGDSSVNLAVRPYCRPEHYWAVYFDIYEQGKEALDAAGIEIPFPQLDIHQK